MMLLLGGTAGILYLIGLLFKAAKAEHSKGAAVVTFAVLFGLAVVIFVWDRSEGGSGFGGSSEFSGRRR